MKIFFKLLFLATSISISCTVKAFTIPLPSSDISVINAQVGTGINVTALDQVLNDLKLINNTIIKPNDAISPTGKYSSSTISGTLNGHFVTISTSNGTPLSQLTLSSPFGKGHTNINTQQFNVTALNSGSLIVTVDGMNVLNGQQVTRANVIDLARILGILTSFNATTSTNLASTSPSSATSQLAYGILDSRVLSRKQQKALLNQKSRPFYFAIGDIKYEQAQFSNNGDKGNIAGATASLSTEVFGIELGAYIPYDYLSFTSFTANRTGTLLYAKRNWQLPKSLQLTTMVNFNYMATYVSNFSLTNTFGGGFGTSLSYDNGGNFVPRISFALQYNQDDYQNANTLFIDNHQYLIKTGASLGYRLLDNATLQAGFIYNRDITNYQSAYNKLQDHDYFDITVGGNYTISDRWQVNLNYKRILGLSYYYSNAIILGAVFGF